MIRVTTPCSDGKHDVDSRRYGRNHCRSDCHLCSCVHPNHNILYTRKLCRLDQKREAFVGKRRTELVVAFIVVFNVWFNDGCPHAFVHEVCAAFEREQVRSDVRGAVNALVRTAHVDELRIVRAVPELAFLVLE